MTGIWNIFAKLREACRSAALGVARRRRAIVIRRWSRLPPSGGRAGGGGRPPRPRVQERGDGEEGRARDRLALGRVRRLYGKSTENDLGDKAVRFRRETIILARRRWFMLTWTTLLSQLALCFVLVLSLRHMGVSEQELPFVEIFAVYSFSRLLCVRSLQAASA